MIRYILPISLMAVLAAPIFNTSSALAQAAVCDAHMKQSHAAHMKRLARTTKSIRQKVKGKNAAAR